MSKVTITNGHHHEDEAEMDRSEGELFLSEAFKVILAEAVRKATDVNEKVPYAFTMTMYNMLYVSCIQQMAVTSRYVSGASRVS